MTLYARIDADRVVELFTPPEGTELADCFHPDLLAQFVEVPEGTDPLPEEGWSYTGETFAEPPAIPPPNLQQQAMMLLGGNINVVCTSVPALDGEYPIDQTAQMQITGIAAAISAGLGLPGGGETFNWPDTSGVGHAWPAVPFVAFAKGVMNFVYNAAQVARGQGAVLPSTTLTIT